MRLQALLEANVIECETCAVQTTGLHTWNRHWLLLWSDRRRTCGPPDTMVIIIGSLVGVLLFPLCHQLVPV